MPWCDSCGYSVALLRFRLGRGVLWEYSFGQEIAFPWGYYEPKSSLRTVGGRRTSLRDNGQISRNNQGLIIGPYP